MQKAVQPYLDRAVGSSKKAVDTAEDRRLAVDEKEMVEKVGHESLPRVFERGESHRTLDWDAMDDGNDGAELLLDGRFGWRLGLEPAGGMVAAAAVEAG